MVNSPFKYGLLSGLIFAVIMALFDFVDRESFRFFKFLFNIIGFGFFMGLGRYYAFKKDKSN